MGLIRRGGRQVVRLIGRLAGDRGETLAMRDALGYFPNLLRPRSFSEKVVSRKLTPAPRVWSEYSDKIVVRDHVARLVGPNYLTDLHLVTDDPDAIRLDSLPQRFVVKANHGSGWNRVVDGRDVVSEDVVRTECRTWLKMRYGITTHEEWYLHIKPRILVEQYLKDTRYGVPLDYKFWVFHHRVEFVQIDFARFSKHTRTIYDRHWTRQPWVTLYPAGPDLARPPMLEPMIEVAEQLAVDPEFVRVDLYSPNDERVVFGELTFAPGAGWEPFFPSKVHDYRVGLLW